MVNKRQTQVSFFRHYTPCFTFPVIFLLSVSGFPTVYYDHIQSVSPISFRFTSTFLFHNFLISLIFCPNLSCPICIAQLLLGVGPALRCGQPNKGHILQENSFSPSQQLSHVNRSSAGHRASWLPTHFKPRICLAWSCKDLVLFVTTTLGSHKQLNCFDEESDILKLSIINGSYNLSTPSTTKNPDTLGKVCVIDIPFMAEHSAVSYSLYIDT